MKTLHFEPMGGSGMTVEADETFIGRKSTSRAYEPPGVKQVVFALVQRDGGVRSFHVPNVTAANLRPIIAKHARTDSRFQSEVPSTVYPYPLCLPPCREPFDQGICATMTTPTPSKATSRS